MTTPISPELSFDGFGINGPTQYRDRLCTFNRNVPSALTPAYSEEQIQHYGNLFASAPDLYAALESILADLETADKKRTVEDYDFAVFHAIAAARDALSKARGMKGGE